MRKWNIFYFAVLPLLMFFLYKLNQLVSLSHTEFYGEAEAKQIEININQDILVTQILIERGVKVKKGDLLMKVQNMEVEENIQQVNIGLDGLDAEKVLEKSDIEAKILELMQKKQTELATLETKYNTAKSEAEFYKELAGIKENDKTTSHPSYALLNALEAEMRKISDDYDRQISHYKRSITTVDNAKWKYDQLNQKKSFLLNSKKYFDIVAPHDGIIGNINVKEGEHIKAHASLVSFMETHPTFVKAYIQEKHKVSLSLGDTVLVKSVYNGEKEVKGIISAVGHRVIEIPEKFLKIPSIKLYGIEVFIKMSENDFFQNQIVTVNPWSSQK